MLDHILMLTDDLEATRAFYCDALGFEVGDRPPLEFPGYWLYLDGKPWVHVAERGAYREWTAGMGLPAVEGPVDHVAFRCAEYDALLARLSGSGVDAVPNEVPGVFRQLFVIDPNGVRIELNFPDE